MIQRLLLALTVSLAVLVSGACSRPDGTEAPGVVVEDDVPPLLVIGIDGATFDRVVPLREQGRLPHLSALMERGSWGPLETIEPTVSPAIWTTVATGALPATHGILGFEGVPGYTMTTLPTSQMRKVRAFWNIFSEHGRSVGVTGWWVTWPAEPVRGYIVSDRAAYTRMEAAIGKDEPRAHEVYPEDLAPEVRSLVRLPNEITPEEIRRFLPLTDEEVQSLLQASSYRHGDVLPEFKYVHQSDRSTADIALRLIRERPTDVTAVAFYGVDTVSHLAWHYMAPAEFPGLEISPGEIEKYGGLIDRYYEYVDRLVGELVHAAGPEANVIVFSDHGFGPSGQLPWSGGHGKITPGAPIAPDGILIMAGPSIRSGVRLERPHVLDLTPTLLYLQGFPLAADMPGGVFSESITEEFSSRVPLRQIPTYEIGPRERPDDAPDAAPELDAATVERLRALGYME